MSDRRDLFEKVRTTAPHTCSVTWFFLVPANKIRKSIPQPWVSIHNHPTLGSRYARKQRNQHACPVVPSKTKWRLYLLPAFLTQFALQLNVTHEPPLLSRCISTAVSALSKPDRQHLRISPTSHFRKLQHGLTRLCNSRQIQWRNLIRK